MSLHLAPLPPPLPRRLKLEDLTRSPQDRQSFWIGVGLSAVVWLLLLAVASVLVNRAGQLHAGGTPPPPPPSVFSIEIEPEAFATPRAPAEPPPPSRFVETNPDAPENVPDNTQNFAAQNQQAAQATPDPLHDNDLPSTKGEGDPANTQIVSGELFEQENPPPVAPPSPELKQAAQEAQQRQAQNPLPGEAKPLTSAEAGFGFSGGVLDQPVTPQANEVQKGSTATPLLVGNAEATTRKIDPQKPQPRRKLQQRVRPAVLADRPEGTSNAGITAADARWSHYGQYLQRLVDSVQIEWERILVSSRTQPPGGSVVKVVFRLDAKEGAVVEIQSTESTAGNQGTRACLAAISNRSPYGPWTDDMRAMLGDSQELTFTFYYY